MNKFFKKLRYLKTYGSRNVIIIGLINWATITRRFRFRYWLILHFTLGYLYNSLEKRKGECKKCGRCESRCIYYDRDKHLCEVYNNRPDWCYKDFPIDKIELKSLGLYEKCGYYWEEK